MSFTHHVVPASYPDSGPVPIHVTELGGSPYAGTATGEFLGGTYLDLSWRWKHHDAVLTDPNGKAYVDDVGTRFNTIDWNLEIGGGDGPFPPYIAGWAASDLVDVRTCPVFTFIVDFASLGLIDNHGAPINLGPIPVNPVNPNSPPYTPYVAPQPIVAYAYSTSGEVWEVVLRATVTWVSDGSNWYGTPNPALYFSVGTNGGTPRSIVLNDPVLSMGCCVLLEFDYTAHTIKMYASPDFSEARTVYVGQLTAVTQMVSPSAHEGVAADLTLGGGNIGAYYWSFYVHVNGYIRAAAVIAGTVADTVTLLNARGAIPGTGPIQTKAAFRTGDQATPSVPARLSEYAHWWPMDDPRPGPMVDLVVGSLLQVASPSVATFQVDGAVSQAGHSKGLRLGSPTSLTYLTRPTVGPAGPSANFGVGGVNHDFTVSMLFKWEGPPIPSTSDTYMLFRSSNVAIGFTSQPAIQAWIGSSYAEPFPVTFQVWDSVAGAFHLIETTGFDWPAGYDEQGSPSHAVKVPVWALATFVYRTNLAGTSVSLEIWVDGVLLKSADVGPHGWGANVWMNQVGLVATSGSIQNLVMWPFALSAAEIAGIAR